MNDGQNINLVLLPGLDGTGLLFTDFIAELPLDVHPHVIAYPPDKLCSLAEYANFVADNLPPGDVVLLAESFSGLVALTLASKIPNSIRGLIFCAAFAEPPRPLLLHVARFLPGAAFLMRSAPDFLLRQFCLGSTATKEQLEPLRKALALVSPEVLTHRLSLIATRVPFAEAQFKVLSLIHI